MYGPFALSNVAIDANVTRTSPGNYALIRSVNGSTVIRYVGRSDTDVKNRLRQHVGTGYSQFKFSYASSPKAAFEEECCNYHDLGGSSKLDNQNHPARPANSGWKCPRCNIFG